MESVEWYHLERMYFQETILLMEESNELLFHSFSAPLLT
ncbi:hypothetical protein J2Z22_003057 [Paenibacillus forsythiae]|uniref:Uncharacterized protein n=1 Tax=Paenibacillus forsythiae TaxID=365616 RepID=A0ABU3H9I8_9BACL|nr:hypothetical protein [Paenibacillus forsythiae]